MKLRIPDTFTKRDAVRIAIPVLALALIASVVTGREKAPEAQAQPASRIDARVGAKPSPAPEPALDLSGLAREPAEALLKPASDPFARLSFAPPPSKAAGESSAAGAPAGPPPLPFTYLGKLVEDGKLKVFVGKDGDSHTLRAGQTIEQYRVDKVTEKSVTFTYLPMKKRQVLEIPAVPS